MTYSKLLAKLLGKWKKLRILSNWHNCNARLSNQVIVPVHLIVGTVGIGTYYVYGTYLTNFS